MNISLSSVVLHELYDPTFRAARFSAAAGAETCGAELSRAETFSAGS